LPSGDAASGRRGSDKHTLESEDDFEAPYVYDAHFGDIYYHLVMHGDVRCPGELPWSIFHR
jgi:hypothetical protein